MAGKTDNRPLPDWSKCRPRILERVEIREAELGGHGVGGKLVEHCVGFARERGYKRMMLWTNSSLESARRIYDAAGFKQTREQPDRVSRGHAGTGDVGRALTGLRS
jgi:ribosomal protein S18 acetylase RimI-like enzyme